MNFGQSIAHAVLSLGMPEGWARLEYGRAEGEPLSAESLFKVLGKGSKPNSLHVSYFYQDSNGIIRPFPSDKPYELKVTEVAHITSEEAKSLGIGRRK